MPRPRFAAVVPLATLALAAVAAVAGCSSPAPAPTTPAPTAPSSSSPSVSVPTPSSSSATTASSEPTGGPFGTSDVSSPGIPELRAGGVGAAVRVGRHPGFDRVVYEFTGPVPASALRGTVFAQVKGLYGGFEGIGQEFVGITGGKRPFRVFTLTGPSRIVIDVQSTS